MKKDKEEEEDLNFTDEESNKDSKDDLTLDDQDDVLDRPNI